jgi:hypothetical protein
MYEKGARSSKFRTHRTRNVCNFSRGPIVLESAVNQTKLFTVTVTYVCKRDEPSQTNARHQAALASQTSSAKPLSFKRVAIVHHDLTPTRVHQLAQTRGIDSDTICLCFKALRRPKSAKGHSQSSRETRTANILIIIISTAIMVGQFLVTRIHYFQCATNIMLKETGNIMIINTITQSAVRIVY